MERLSKHCDCGQRLESDDKRWNGKHARQCRECKYTEAMERLGKRNAKGTNDAS